MDPGYELSIEELRVWNKTLINLIRTDKLRNGYTDPYSRTWDTDPVSISNITGVCTLIALGVVTTNQNWRSKDNIVYSLSPQELVQLAGGLAIYIKTCYEISWVHKSAIDSFTDINDILNYNIDVNWP